jgi:hypothetical protein
LRDCAEPSPSTCLHDQHRRRARDHRRAMEKRAAGLREVEASGSGPMRFSTG